MAAIDDSELIRISDFSDQASLKFLSGGCSRLVPPTSAHSAKLDSVNSMEAKFVEIQKTLSQICNQLGIHPIEAETSRQTLPVPHSDPYTRAASNRLTLDNRKSLLRKIEMPKFDGSNASDWLSKVERFFRVGRYSDLDKLDLVALSLEGDVLKWFNWELIRRKFQSWEEFRHRLFRRFGTAPEQSPRNRLFALRQTGTISAYVTEFEELSSQVVGLDELHLEEIFYKGLKPEMREVLKSKEPVGLENQKKAVLRMETSSFCHLSSDKSTKAWGSQKPFTPKPVTTSTQPRPLLLPIGEGQGTGQIVAATPPVLPPYRRHTAEQQPVHMEESITHLQVPVSKLQEHSLQMHNESPNVCENSQAVVGCEQQRSMLQISHVKEMEEFPSQSTNGNSDNGAHKLIAQIPSKEVNMLSGLSQTHQVWEPGGVLAEHVLVDWLVDFPSSDGIVDGIRCLTIGVCSGITQPIDSRRASRVWERGGLDISAGLTDWLMKCYKGFEISRLMRQLHKIDFQWVRRKDLADLCVGHGLLVFPWNLMLFEFFLFIHLEDKVCLSGASISWWGWLVFDRGKNHIISGDVITRVFLDLKKFLCEEVHRVSCLSLAAQFNSLEIIQAVLEQIIQRDEEASTKTIDKLQTKLKQRMDLRGASWHCSLDEMNQFHSPIGLVDALHPGLGEAVHTLPATGQKIASIWHR